MKPTLMLIGLGDLGGLTLELLAREPALGRIVATDRNTQRGVRRCNLVRVGALAQGREPEIEFATLDLNERAATAAAVRRINPDLILSTATMLSWWVPELLPTPQRERILRPGFGVWLPVHLAPALKLMEALRDADYQGLTLTAPFPDVVNPILAKRGPAPTCGIGNLAEIVPKLRLLAAERLGVWPDAVKVELVAHHALEAAVYGGAAQEIPPYHLRLEHEGRDVTAEIDAEALLLAPYPLPAGRAQHFLTAGTAVRLARALFSDAETYTHAPAPGGLPGGYPVLASRAGVRPAPLAGLTLDEAIAINERSHRYDGIERIEADGTAVFVPGRAAMLREELGYDCERLAPADADERARELVARFQAYARKHGVTII